ncbi:mgpp2cl-1, protein phosphatase 2C-like protein 1 [Pleosporales sp. CAS-2024a]
MFGSAKDDDGAPADASTAADGSKAASATAPSASAMPADDASHASAKPSGNGAASADRKTSDAGATPTTEKKRRSSGVSRARDMFSSAKNSLHLSGSSPTSNSAPADKADKNSLQTPMQKLGKTDAALSVPQGSLNNSAGESAPGPRSTFRVGVTEDKNKKCRRTMEDTHAYLYNFLSTPAPSYGQEQRQSASDAGCAMADVAAQHVVETDNGYFAIFDGHAGTFAADWCGKKLHLILEDVIRKNPNTPIPELLDQTFTSVDQQLEKLPLKNSGCTAVIAVLRWEDRVPNAHSSTGSVLFAPAAVSAIKNADGGEVKAEGTDAPVPETVGDQSVETRLRSEASRQRVLYTANVGDARIVLCRNGRALRLSYDHKGSDENEGRRVASAGGLILNNRVNGVLAVTRALGDAYMKDLVTGHPYTTETVIQADQDEFMILACDGLWDVCSDQEAVDLIRHVQDPQEASKKLVDYALARFSTDNLSCMVVRFDNKALRQRKHEAAMGVEGDQATVKGGVTEAEAIVAQARKSIGDAEQSTESATQEIIMEESEAEPGPELSMDAARAAQKNKV